MAKSQNLLDNLIRINNWIEDNLDNIGNANMYEIMNCMLERNDIQISEGENDNINAEIDKMLDLRKVSIFELFFCVPECEKLYNAVKDGSVTASSDEEMDFICRCESVPFYINNIRVRNDGDIARMDEDLGTHPDFQHDNVNEIMKMIECYNNASDKLKELTYKPLNWVINNSILKNEISIEPVKEEKNIKKMVK